LIESGHSKIVFLAGPPADPSAQERREGYRRAFREMRLESDDCFVFNSGTTIEDGAAAAVQVLQETPEATAIEANNDAVAIGAANILLKQGLKIPGDISIAGFGNSQLGEHFCVPLTTVRQPKYGLGVAAMAAMEARIRNTPIDLRRLPTELCVRSSTGSVITPVQ
jgi:DNA-binding LacI/PurR family transcriptional regulator